VSVTRPEVDPLWRGRWLLYAIGTGMGVYGLIGLWGAVPHSEVLHTLRLLLVNLFVHDGLIASGLCATGYVIGRVLPAAARTPVQVGLAIAGALSLLAVPVIYSTHRLRTPSVLPLDYGRNLTVLLVIVGVGVLGATLVNVIRSRR
jgi:hypothetical protein